uniref:Cytochrome c oxidase subunit 7A1, mitochondrial n=1 Tax=Scophthalmus maximus TaxID=52904 RepID=A0A8D3D5Y5_SCOMX
SRLRFSTSHSSNLNSYEDNGLPVHLKGGSRDVLLYRATMTLTLAGTCYSVYSLFKASMPQKKA